MTEYLEDIGIHPEDFIHYDELEGEEETPPK